MYLRDVAPVAIFHRENLSSGLKGFLGEPRIAALGWPTDVLEQWLYDHAENWHFQGDYGHIPLELLEWTLEEVSLEVFCDMQTGASEPGLVDYFAVEHEHWVEVRERSGSRVHEGVQRSWDADGTWKRPPILIARNLVQSGGEGLQVIEGRTRVGVLRGRRRDGLYVADAHAAWVGRPKTAH